MYVQSGKGGGGSSPGCSMGLLYPFVAILRSHPPPLLNSCLYEPNQNKKNFNKNQRRNPKIQNNKEEGDLREGETYSIQPSARQNSLCRGRHTAPIPLQIPYDFPAAKLGKHGLDQIDLCGVGPAAMTQAAGRLSPTRGRGREKEVAESEEEEDEDEK